MSPKNRKLRVVTAVLLVAWVAILVGFLLYRQWQRRGLVTEVEMQPERSRHSEQPVRVQKGFVFTYALGVSPSFRVAAQESVEYASGWLELRVVDVTFFQEGQVAYGLAAQSARFNHLKNEAIIQGEPQINFGNGVVVRAEAFSLTGSESRLASAGTVTLAGPGWGGVAGNLESLVGANEVRLGGGVTVVASAVWGEAITLLAPSVTYRHREGMVLFSEGVDVFRGQLRLQAPSGSLWLDGARGGVEKLSLQGRVSLTGTTESGELLEGEFSEGVAVREDGGHIAFSAGPARVSGWVTMRVIKPGEGWRELRCWRLSGRASATGLTSLKAEGLACATTVTPGEAPIQLAANTLLLEFPENQGAQAHAVGNVVMERDKDRIFGDEMTATLPQGPGQVWAKDQGQTRFETEALKGACQRLSFEPRGNFTATGGVQGTVQPKGGDRQRGPVRFAAERAFGDFRTGDAVTLEGEARVWEGEQVIKARAIAVDRAQELLRASGQVLTEASAPEGRFSIEAAELSYNQQTGVAEYRGGVTVQDGRGVLRSQSLTAYLSEQGEVLRADFHEQVSIVDQQGGRSITGDAASYTTSTDAIVIRGKPAIVEETAGNKVVAETITWYRRTGNLEVGGALESPSQTVYHPIQLANPPVGRTPSPRKP